MKIIFFGSGSFGIPCLRALLDSQHKIIAVLTQPDKPAGRGHKMRMPSTKLLAHEYSIPVYQPPNVGAPDNVKLIQQFQPDCIGVVAYGQIIPPTILAIPDKGIINVHGSILPAYRGAAPIQWALARGESQTGVTTMLMDEGLDTGPILMKQHAPIHADDNASSLSDRLAPIGAALLLETLELWEANELTPILQDESLKSLAPIIKRQDALVDWEWNAHEIARYIRAFNPWPVAHVKHQATRLKLWRASVAEPLHHPPGTILSIDAEGLRIACGHGTCLLLKEIQADGRQRMSATTWARGSRLRIFDRL